ncbi:recombinase RecT [Xanthobacter autotrophicus]|uniref:recombinase RecT n=1 Tax=Xanthobacter autotrophicus TaxID=280 RepID=UPI00372ADADC
MNALAPINVQSTAIRAMVPQTMDEVFHLADAVHRSGLAPTGLKNVQAVAIAIMTGLELGVPPMTALQRIAVINGRPTIWGDLAIALVRASGLAETIKEEILGEGDDRIAICTVKRKGDPQPVVGSFSVADAKRARLWDPREKVTRRRQDGNGTYETLNDAPWHRFPERMMKMRARAFALRDGFADVLGGLYLREELEEEQVEIRDVTPPTAPPPPVTEEKKAPAPPAPAPAALAPLDPRVDLPSPLDRVTTPEVRDMVLSSPSAPVGLAQKAPAPPPPSIASAPAREERAPSQEEGTPGPDRAPSPAPFPNMVPHLVTLWAELGKCQNPTALENTWTFEEDDINAWSKADRELAAALYERRLAELCRKG